MQELLPLDRLARRLADLARRCAEEMQSADIEALDQAAEAILVLKQLGESARLSGSLFDLRYGPHP